MEPNTESITTPAITTQAITKRLWRLVRVVFFMIRKGISKSKLMLDLHHLMMKRGKLAGKAIGNLMFHHHNHHSSATHLAFVPPKEYEFSCSNSPAYPSSSSSNYFPFPFHMISGKRKNHHHRHNNNYYFSPMRPSSSSSAADDDILTAAAVQKLLEMLNNEAEVAALASPSPALPGFGRSPMVRQLRITDSPFPLRNDDVDDNHVDEKAEAFIEKFYEQLKQQALVC